MFESVWTEGSWAALGAIVVINLVLSGDNAIVIAFAVRNLPPAHQRQAIVWGTAGAVLVRVALALIIVWLLGIPWLRAVGAVLLAWIAFRLVTEDKTEARQSLAGKATFRGAMQTIIVADATMGLDNVLGVAGAAEGNMFLLAGGMLLSIPIVVWGSTLLLRLLERFPGLLYIGGAVLAWTAGGMLMDEPGINAVLGKHQGTRLAIEAGVTAAVLAAAWLRNRYAGLTTKLRQR